MKFGGCVCQGCGNEFEGDVVGGHRILVGDATKAEDVARVTGDARPVLMVTDPPYGVKYDPNWRTGAGLDQWGKLRQVGLVANDDRWDWSPAWELFSGNVVYVWHAPTFGPIVQETLEVAKFLTRYQIVWRKQHFVIGRGDYHWQHEGCIYAVRDGATANWQGDRKQATVWDIMSFTSAGGHRDEEKTGHGTQKPAECMARPIRNNTRVGDVVYDPFLGSGTTMIAAEMSGRFCIGIELAPAYVDIAVKRWQTYVEAPGLLAPGAAGHAVLAGDGRTFDQVARARKRGVDDAKGDPGKSVQRRRRSAGAVAPMAQ